MLKNKLLVAALATSFALPAFAEEASPVSANIGYYSDYIFRGITQTAGGPALQGGFDYAHDSGLYAGAWASNISNLGDLAVADGASMELDTYVGFSGSITEDVGYDVGYLRYNYPGVYGTGNTKADTDELYGAVSWKWVSLKYSYSLGDTFGFKDAGGSAYVDLSASYTLEGAGVTLDAHYGSQTFAGTGNDVYDYTDYKLGVSKDVGGYSLGLAYSATDTKKGLGELYNAVLLDGSDIDLGKSTVILSVSKSM